MTKIVVMTAAVAASVFAFAETNAVARTETEADLLVAGRLSTYNSAVTNVRAGAFMECRGLAACNLECAQTVGVGAFRGCVVLETVYAGAVSNLTGWTAMFAGCPRLKDVHLPLVGVDAAKAAGLPFGTTSRTVVFHLADGDCDRNGNRVD